MSKLDKLFNPESIAVVGASNNPSKVGYQLFHALRHFPGKLIPVNRTGGEVQGIRAYPNLKALNHPVDLVILCVPAAACLDAVEQAGELGSAAVLITGGGFEESGEDGKQLQGIIVDTCRKYGIRLLGPNTAGVVNPRHKLAANFSPLAGRFSPGHISVVSQSGAMSIVISTMLESKGLGISIGVGIGNGPDISTPEILEYLADHTETGVIAVYLEGVTDGRRLYEAIAATTLKKPVVVYPVGNSDIGEFAQSHTGKLIDSFALKKAALIQAGAVVVSSSNDLVDAVHALSHIRLSPLENAGVGILSGQAGPAMTITDYLLGLSINVPELEPKSVEAIARELLLNTYKKNPVDTARPDQQSFGKILTIIAADPRIDLILAYAMYEPMCVRPVQLFHDLGRSIDKPILFATSGFPIDIEPTIRNLDEMGIPAYDSPERAAVAVRALIEDARSAARKQNRPISEKKSALVEKIIEKPDEAYSKAILSQLGFNIPSGRICESRSDALQAFYKLDKPLAVKVLSTDITHKTDVGGICLNIDTQEKLISALDQIDAIDLKGGRKYLLEEMVSDGLEIIIGAKNDESFGPSVLLGLGGTRTEVFDDVSLRLAPLSVDDGLDMIDELKARALFNAWRGGPRYDKEAVAEALVRIGSFIVGHPEVKEIDLNPVRIYESGMIVLDALIICTEKE